MFAPVLNWDVLTLFSHKQLGRPFAAQQEIDPDAEPQALWQTMAAIFEYGMDP